MDDRQETIAITSYRLLSIVHRRLLIVVAISGFIALYCLAIWFDWLPWLRGWGDIYTGGWVWPLYHAPTAHVLVVVAIIGAIWAVILLAEYLHSLSGVARATWGKRATVATFLVILVGAGYCLQLAMLGLKADNANGLLVQRITDRNFTSYFSFALAHPQLNDYFRGYPATLDNNPYPHTRAHPPGPSLYYWLALRAVRPLPADWQNGLASPVRNYVANNDNTTTSGQALTDEQVVAALVGGTLLLLLACATVVPLFGLARLLGPPGYEFRLSALGLVMPGLILMTPSFDQAYALISATAIYCAIRALASCEVSTCAAWAASTGVILAAGLFCSWALIYALLIVVGLGVAHFTGLSRLFPTGYTREHITPKRSAAWSGGLFAGLLIPLAALTMLTKINLITVFQVNVENLAKWDAMRPYWPWIIFGPLDLVQFLGVPLAILTARSLILHRSAHKEPRTTNDATESENSPLTPHPSPLTKVNIYACAFIVAALIHDLSGKNLGEQGRLLIFLMPVALIAIYRWASNDYENRKLIAALFFAQATVCVAIGARWFVP